MLDKKKLRSLSRNLIAEPDNYMNSFRKNVQMYIDEKDVTITQLAEAADISESTLKSFLYGDSQDCKLSNVIRLAKALNVSIDELVGAGTISPQTCQSLQLVRQLPESFTHFVRWSIIFHYDMLTSNKVSEYAIEVMNAEIGDSGSMKMTNVMSLIDITGLNEDIRPKIFMGIKMPGDMYAPKYYIGDILLIANDRPARENEPVVVVNGENMWLLSRKEEIDADGQKVINYYSIRDGGFRCHENRIKQIIGYVVRVKRIMYDEA